MPDFWHGRRVCVTGGSGFLGYHVVQQLLRRGALVRVLNLPPQPAHPLLAQVRVVKFFGDLGDLSLVRRALADCEVIFHTAGVVAVWGPVLDKMHEVHVTGTRNVLAAAPAGARLVHTSSIVAVGASATGETLDENSAFNLATLKVDYVRAKRAAEETALDAAARGRHVVVTNPGYLVGPEDYQQSVMGRFCQRFWKGRMLLAPPGGLNLVDVRDVAAGLLLAAEKGLPGRRYILGGHNHSVHRFMSLLAQAAGMRPRAMPRVACWALAALAGLAEGYAWFSGREPYPSFQHTRLNRYFWFYKSDRAARELGYRCRALEQTLADTYRWHVLTGRLSLRGLRRWWMHPVRETSTASPQSSPALACPVGSGERAGFATAEEEGLAGKT